MVIFEIFEFLENCISNGRKKSNLHEYLAFKTLNICIILISYEKLVYF